MQLQHAGHVFYPRKRFKFNERCRGAFLVGDEGLAFAQLLTAISRGASDYEDTGFAGQSSRQQTTCIQLFKMKGLRFSMGYLIPE
jgi:hypothetical protein